MTNPHEQLRREQKASALAVVLARLGCSAADAERLDATARRQAADLAGVNVPSAATWDLVVARLSERPELAEAAS
jgi:hypothetical protein